MRAQAAKDPSSVQGAEDVTLCPPVRSAGSTPVVCICATKIKAGQGACPWVRVDPDDYQTDLSRSRWVLCSWHTVIAVSLPHKIVVYFLRCARTYHHVSLSVIP